MGKNRIMIYGPKSDGTYLVEFRTSEGAQYRQRHIEMNCQALLRIIRTVLSLFGQVISQHLGRTDNVDPLGERKQVAMTVPGFGLFLGTSKSPRNSHRSDLAVVSRRL